MTTQLVLAIIGILGAPITLAVQWLLGRRKATVDVAATTTNTAVGSAQDAVEIMQQVMIELKEQVTSLKLENAELKAQVYQLHLEINKLKNQKT